MTASDVHALLSVLEVGNPVNKLMDHESLLEFFDDGSDDEDEARRRFEHDDYSGSDDDGYSDDNEYFDDEIDSVSGPRVSNNEPRSDAHEVGHVENDQDAGEAAKPPRD